MQHRTSNSRPVSVVAATLLLLPGAAFAASRSYEPGAFESVSIAAGLDVQITMGTAYSVIAETQSNGFDDLRITVQDKVLKIERPPRGWFVFGRPNYLVRIVTPVLRSLTASAGVDVQVKGSMAGDFTVDASSGSDVHVAMIRGTSVKARVSSGGDLELAGTCSTLEAEASSGSDLDAGSLHCETVTVHASSGSDVSVWASRSVKGKASSGSDVKIGGAPPVVQLEKSAGADVTVGD